MFENRVLKKIFQPKREEVTEDTRKSHNEKLHALHFSSYIIQVIKSRRMRWLVYVAHIGRGGGTQMHTGFWW